MIIDDLINRVLNGEGNSDQHVLTIFGIAMSLRPKNILELGIYEGVTSQPLAFAAKLTGAKLTSVDKYIRPQNFQKDLEPYIERVQKDSIEFLKEEVQKGSQYDLVYIDDWHEYSHVKEELELIGEMVTNKSIILLHDLLAFTCPAYHQPLEAPKGTEWGEGGLSRS